MKVFIFVIAFFAYRAHTSTCPSGSTSPAGGVNGWDWSCSSGFVLFRGNTDEESICCHESSLEKCTHTGMTARFYRVVTAVGPQYVSKKDNHLDSGIRPYVYEANEGASHFLCPYPIGYLWFNQYTPMYLDVPPAKYLPTDHADITTKLKTCQANKECGNDGFCGDVINKSFDSKQRGTCPRTGKVCKFYIDCNTRELWKNCIKPYDIVPHADEKQHFCYKRPEITGNNAGVSQFLVQPLKRNLVFCTIDDDCSNGADTSALCDTSLRPKDNYERDLDWAEYIPNPDPTLMSARKNHPGLCVEAKPIAHIFSNIFDGLSPADKQGSAGKKYLPVDFEHDKHREEFNKCSRNAGCSDKQFCGNMISLRDPAKFDSVNKFCYAVPEIAAPRKYIVAPESLGLLPCNTDQDCVNSFCHIGTGQQQQYAKKDGSTTKLYKGLCAEDPDNSSDSSMLIIIIVVVVLVVIILAALIGGLIFYKLKTKNKKKEKSKKGKGKEKEKNDKKKDKKGKKRKKAKKPSISTASTTSKSTSITGQSGTGMSSGVSPSVF